MPETSVHWDHSSSQDNSSTINEVGDRREQTQGNNSEGNFWASVATSKTLKVESYLPGKSNVVNSYLNHVNQRLLFTT